MDTPTPKELAGKAALARKQGRLVDGRRFAAAAVALFRNDGPERMLVRGLMLQGQIERDDKQLDKALEFYQEAVELSRKIDEPLRFAHTVRHLADLHCDLEMLELAEPCYVEALTIYRSAPNASPGDLANAVRGFAVMQDAAGATDEARSLWSEARDIYELLGVDEGVQECENRMAAIRRS